MRWLFRMPKTPGGHHQESGAGKQNPHQADGEFALLTVKAQRDDIDQQRRREHTDEHNNRHRKRQDRAHRARHAAGFLFVAFLQQARVNRNERRGQHAFPEQVLQEIGDLKAGVKASAASVN